MCGSDERISIERVGNGYTIDAYKPGGEGKPGKHHRSVATSPQHVMKTIGTHLGKGGKKRRGGGMVMLSEGDSASRPSKKMKRKGAARKKVYA
jgi:hypothetical protein